MSNDAPLYQFVMEFYRKKDPHEHLGTFAANPDWEPAREWARFRAMSRDPAPPYFVGAEAGTIEPRWHAKAGKPYVAGISVVMPYNGRPPVAVGIPLSYFAEAARTASSNLVDSGKLADGDLFEYVVCAYACTQPDPNPTPPSRFAIKPVQQALDVSDLPMDHLLADSLMCGRSADKQLPVFLPRAIVDEAAELMGRAGDKETGGILIGHLHRDPGRRQLFLKATAQVPAEHAEQELARLTFTPDTWTAVDAVLASRGLGEIPLGWWHTHPASHWCDDCPPEKRQQCKIAGNASGDFFSAHDVALHRAVFPRAYSVALVLSDGCGKADAAARRLFGWHRGMVAARGFYFLNAARPPRAAAAQLGAIAHDST
jgi:hypothetical protein